MAKRYYADPMTSYKRRFLGAGAYQVHSESLTANPVFKKRTYTGVPNRYRGYFRRSGFYGRYTRGAQLRRLRRGLHIERKFFDTNLAFNIDTTGEIPATGQLNLIPQGVTATTRVGRQCQIKSIQVRATVQYVPGADTVGSAQVWIYLVQDRQANGAAAAVTDVLTSDDFNIAMINLANSERFRVIRRWAITLQAGAGVQGAFGRDHKTIDEYIRVNTPVEFSSTTGAITELKSNNYFLMAGTSAAATDDEVAVAGTCRLRFTDL